MSFGSREPFSEYLADDTSQPFYILYLTTYKSWTKIYFLNKSLSWLDNLRIDINTIKKQYLII